MPTFIPARGRTQHLAGACVNRIGKERRTETAIGGLPGGSYILMILEQLDLIIYPRDRNYENHVASVVQNYDPAILKSLRELWITRNSSLTTSQHLSLFTTDGLIEYPHNGPGAIKSELRSTIKHVLDDLGV